MSKKKKKKFIVATAVMRFFLFLGTCYEEVRKKTNEMKKTFMNYNPYLGEKQQIPDASLSGQTNDKASSSPQQDREVWRGKRIVEAKKPQESWFRKIYRHESNE